jgi:hypothetical protein
MRVGERRQDELTSRKVTEALRVHRKRGFEAAFADLLRQGVQPVLARAVLISGRERRSGERRVAVPDGVVRRIIRA